MADNPLDQFLIKPLIILESGGEDPDLTYTDIDLAFTHISFTNSSLYMVLTVSIIVGLLALGMRHSLLVPGRLQSLSEVMFEFVSSMLKDTAGPGGRKYFPIIFTVFMFILVANLLGMTPYSFTVTSHIIVTFALALFLFIGITLIAIFNHGLGFFKHFLPSGTPLIMAPLMIMIEVFAYLVRPVSLSIRLAANMMAGHVLLKVLASFVGKGLVGILPFLFVVLMTGFEIFIAMLQAYIFAILTCVYLSEAVGDH